MRQYELTYLVSDNVSESEITKVTGKIGGEIVNEGGKVLKEESWGRRKLAYPIAKQLFATYITVSFELEPEKLRLIEREVKHDSDIIRHLIIVRDFGKEELTLTAKDIADTEEITEVVGGEKSFEAVEGETEESKDLMAVRGEEEAEETEELKNQGSKEQKIEAPVEDKTEEVKAEEPVVEKAPENKSEEIKTEKPVKKVAAKKPAVKKETKKIEPKDDKAVEQKAEKSENPKPNEANKASEAKKVVKKKAIKKDESVSDEADRLAKLNEELDEILGEDL